MEKTFEDVNQDVNKTILNCFLYGIDIADANIHAIYARYSTEEYKTFTDLWSEKVKLIDKGLQRLN